VYPFENISRKAAKEQSRKGFLSALITLRHCVK